VIKIGKNILAENIVRNLTRTATDLSIVFERLASGQRINKASDDPAGLAMAESLRTDSRILGQAQRNINDGISAISIASSAITSLAQVVTRMTELAQQSANGVYSSRQRDAMEVEFQALNSEYSRIVEATQFNNQGLLQGGNIDIAGGAKASSITSIALPDLAQDLSFEVDTDGFINLSLPGTDTVSAWTGSEGVTLDRWHSWLIDPGWITPPGIVSSSTSLTFTTTFELNPLDSSLNAITPGTPIGGYIEFDFAVDNSASVSLNGNTTAIGGGYGALSNSGQLTGLQAGTNTLVFTITNDFNTPTGLLVKNMQGEYQSAADPNGGSGLSISTVSLARSTLTQLNQVQETLSTSQADLGATQSRLDIQLNTIAARRENYLAAESRIRDADIAEESSKLIALTIRQQVATSLLAQANQMPALALRLLKG
jgi:flagellin